MSDLMRDTIFGRLLQVASGGRLLPWEEEKNPSRLLHYNDTRPAVSYDISAGTSKDAKDDQETGEDYQIIDWDQNDPEVYLALVVSSDLC